MGWRQLHTQRMNFSVQSPTLGLQVKGKTISSNSKIYAQNPHLRHVAQREHTGAHIIQITAKSMPECKHLSQERRGT